MAQNNLPEGVIISAPVLMTVVIPLKQVKKESPSESNAGWIVLGVLGGLVLLVCVFYAYTKRAVSPMPNTPNPPYAQLEAGSYDMHSSAQMHHYHPQWGASACSYHPHAQPQECVDNTMCSTHFYGQTHAPPQIQAHQQQYHHQQQLYRILIY